MAVNRTRNIVIIITIISMLLLLTGFETSDAVMAKTSPAKVKISSLKAKGKIVTVKWKKAKGAKKYQVYVKVGKKNFKKVKTLKERKYKFKGKYNTLYKVKVRGINSNTKGKFSAIKKVRTAKSYYQKATDNLKTLKSIIQKSPYVGGNGNHYITSVLKDPEGKTIESRIYYHEKEKLFAFWTYREMDTPHAGLIMFANYYLKMNVGSNKLVDAGARYYNKNLKFVEYKTTINVRDCDFDDTHPYYDLNGNLATSADTIYQCTEYEHDALQCWNELLKQHDLSLYKIGWRKYI